MKNTRSRLRTVLIAAPVLVVAAVGGRSVFVNVREDLDRQRAAIDAGWSEVNAALDERAALIPAFAEAARRASRSPAAAANEVAEARAGLARAATPEARIKANQRLSDALAHVLLSTEKDPRIAADPTFSRLEDEVKDSEERIAVARRKYNESLEHYNARIQQFPNNLVSRISGFRRNDAYFHTEPY